MKRIKLIALALASILTLGFTACGGTTPGDPDSSGSSEIINESIDASKTQIWIDHYNGGVGSAWFAPLKERFEAAYADYRIGDKVGVQLKLSNHKDMGSQQINSVSSSDMDVFLSEAFDYYDGITKDLFLDITDVVTGMNSDGKTIESKYNEEQRRYYNYNGKYYGIPHYTIYTGLVYNITLFEDELLYLSANPSVNGGFITSLSDTRSLGPDGKTGIIGGIDYSEDDGLPATYDEFFKVCDRMVANDIIPFTWSGMYGKAYFHGLLNRLTANYEGKDQLMLNFTFNGTATNLIKSINDDGSVVLDDPTNITVDNGYEIYRSAGRYYALKFLEKIASNQDYYDYVNAAKTGSDSHTDAQTRYILSKYNRKSKPIAFLVDGAYWENEAYDVGAFSTLKTVYHVDRKDTKFGYMPLPKVDASHIGDTEVVLDNASSLAFINKNVEQRCPEKIELLKEFLKFAYTDESLREYTVKTNNLKALEYDLTEEDVSGLAYFTQTLIKLRDRAEQVYPFDNNAKYVDNRSSLNISATYVTDNYKFAAVALIDDKVSAKNYFNELVGYRRTKW